jgi:HAD hydrolase, family IIA
MMKDKFQQDISKLALKKLYLLDMDGTIYLGNDLFPATKPFLKRIRDKGGKYVFITNNSSKSVHDYVEKLQRLGIEDVNEEDFFTSAQAAAILMKQRYKNDLIYVQGTKSFVEGLKKEGLSVTGEIDERVAAVLVGFDLELNMEKLTKTCKLLTRFKNIPYYATNLDWVCPTEWGSVPDCGSMCFGIEKATGRRPVFIGKPEPTMIEKVMEKFHYQKEDTVVVGDRLYTDIKSGNNAGVTTICVLSGEVTLEEVISCPKEEKPTFCLNSVAEII